MISSVVNCFRDMSLATRNHVVSRPDSVTLWVDSDSRTRSVSRRCVSGPPPPRREQRFPPSGQPMSSIRRHNLTRNTGPSASVRPGCQIGRTSCAIKNFRGRFGRREKPANANNRNRLSSWLLQRQSAQQLIKDRDILGSNVTQWSPSNSWVVSAILVHFSGRASADIGKQPTAARIHSHLTAVGHCHHRDSHFFVAAGGAAGTRGRSADSVQEQPEITRPSPPQLS